VIRADLDWEAGWMAADEQVIDWLDRVHPVQYGYVDRRYLWGVGLAQEPTAERYSRCPTCEQWSPCQVRQKLLPLVRAGHTCEERS
jgi:hypothetical protein